MTRSSRSIILSLVAAVAALLLTFYVSHPELARDPVRPQEAIELARWLQEHPADAIAASTLADAALDSNLPRRRELWVASFEHASHLSPRRPNAAAGFVRAGLFHWYELDAIERKRVLEVAVPLMAEPRFFGRMYEPIWSLTRDFAYLRRVAPVTVSALEDLRTLAVGRGLFRDYRELRETIRQRRLEELLAKRGQATHPGELLELVPRTLDAGEAPLVRAILEELDRKPFAPEQISGRIDSVVTFALDHGVGPLQGILPLLEIQGALRDVTRARAALAIGNPTLASRVEITTEVPGTAEWTPYHLERAIYEAGKGEAAAADAQLKEAAAAGLTPAVLGTALEVATLLRDPAAADAAHRELDALASRPLVWSNLCSPNELCSSGMAQRYIAKTDEVLAIALSVSQSDETPPYVEIYANDALVAEGDVRDARTFTFKPGEGLQRIEVRMVNPKTRNGVQRRLRLS